MGLVTVEMKGFQVIKWFGPTEDGTRGISYCGWWAGTIVGPKTWKVSPRRAGLEWCVCWVCLLVGVGGGVW